MMTNKTLPIVVASCLSAVGLACAGVISTSSTQTKTVSVEAKRATTYEAVTNEEKMYSTSSLIFATPYSFTAGIIDKQNDKQNGFKVNNKATFSKDYSTVSVENDVEICFTAIKEETYTRMITSSGKLLSASDGNLTLSDDVNDSTKFNVNFDNEEVTLTSLEGSTIRFSILEQTLSSRKTKSLLSVLPRIYSKPKNTASSFSSTFISSVGCDKSGSNAPTMSKSWTELNALYDSLSASEKRLLKNATYSVSGVGNETVVTATSSTTVEVAEAMYLYDCIVAKYNWDNFIGRNVALSSLRLSPVNTLASSLSDKMSVLTICSLLAVGALITFLVIKTSKLDNKE